MELQVGSILEGKVTTITKFGAFVSLGEGKSGLVHISEITHTFVNDVHDYLQEGQTVKVRVLSAENGKVNLSIKKALPPEARAPQPSHGGPSRFGPRSGAPASIPHRPAAPIRRSFGRVQQPLAASGDLSFEDKLKQFMTQSDSKMADLNRNIDGKRSGGRRRK